MSSSQFQLPECPATGSSIAGSSIDIERPSATTSSRGSSNANASRAGGGSSLSVCEGRQRLQRGAKDKVYATRLAYDYNSSRDDNKYVESTAVVGRDCGAATATTGGATDTSNSRNATRVKRRKPDGNKSDSSSHLRSDDGTKKRKRCGESKSQQPTSNDVAAAPPPPLAPTDWACNQCTCSNSSRRKKCQACGFLRCVLVNSDGTCKLDELCNAKNGNNIGGIINCTLGSTNNTPSTTTSASDDQCFFSQEGEVQYQSQVYVMMKEPLYTRSKRKERLSQQTESSSMTQFKEREQNNDDQADIIQPQHPPSSHEQQPTLALSESQYEDGSGFKQWIRKRHTAKRQKRQSAKVRTVDDDGNHDNPSIVESALSSPGEMKYVAVQIRSLLGEVSLNLDHRKDLPENDADIELSSLARLSAYIPLAVLARIPVQPDDNDRVDKSLGEMTEVTVRIRTPAGDTTLPSAHQQDAWESADTNLRLTACIPEAVLSRISVQPDTQQEEYNETELFSHSNDDGSCDRNNGACVRELPNSELQQSPSCDGYTGKDVAPTDAMIQGDGNSNDMKKMRERHVSSLESELQREDDTSHQLIDVSCPIIEGIQAKATAPDSSYTNTLERCRAVERTLQMSPSETHPPTESDSSGGIIISTTKRCSSDDLASKLAHELLDNNAYISKVPPTSHVQHSSQGSVSVDSPFIPMTQQPLDFDYFSQMSQVSVVLDLGISFVELVSDTFIFIDVLFIHTDFLWYSEKC